MQDGNFVGFFANPDTTRAMGGAAKQATAGNAVSEEAEGYRAPDVAARRARSGRRAWHKKNTKFA